MSLIRFRPLRFLKIALALALAAALVHWLMSASQDVPPPLGSPVARPISTAAPSVQAPATTDSAPAKGASAPHVSEMVTHWFRAFAAIDPYPSVIALRELRQEGSFGAAVSITTVCVEANLALTSPLYALDKAVNDPNYQQRLQARHLLQARCTSFDGEQILILTEPLPNDPSGVRLREAKGRFTTTLTTRHQIRQSLEELAAQGRLYDALNSLGLEAKWRGESWRSNEEVFSHAIEIARFRTSSQPDMEAGDIRLALRCLKSGRCGGYESMPEHFTDAMKQQTLSLAKDIEQAIRAGDVAALMGS